MMAGMRRCCILQRPAATFEKNENKAIGYIACCKIKDVVAICNVQLYFRKLIRLATVYWFKRKNNFLLQSILTKI